MISILYTVLFILSVILLIALVTMNKTTNSMNYALMFACVAVSNFGYMKLGMAANLEAAVLANQIVYLGSCFSPFFMLLSVSDLCKVKINRYAVGGILACGIGIFAMIVNTDVFSGYYKALNIVTINGSTFLEKEYGPLHIVYPIYLVVILGFCIFMIMQAFFGNNEVSVLTTTLLIISMGLLVFVYIFERVIGLKFELLPAAFVFAQAGVVILLRRIRMYDVMSISAKNMVDSKDYGFILYDSDGKFLGSDIAAKIWFPEIKDIQVDSTIDSVDSPLIDQMSVWIRSLESEDVVLIPTGDLIIEARHEVIKEKKRKNIHCVYLMDDTEHQEFLKLEKAYQEALERDVDEKSKTIHDIQSDIIISMASIVENRDNNTGGHIARTSDVVKVFVNNLMRDDIIFEWHDLTNKEEIAECVIKAAPLHDFGKVGVPDVILHKPGKFTDEEYAEMKKHSEKGAVIVSRILQNSEDELFKEIAINVAHYHHEKWDGSGYPDNLKGEDIPLEARIMALADVFDALVSKRVYKDAFSYDDAFRIIRESRGTHFEPRLCSAFLRYEQDFIDLYDSYED